MLNLGVLTALLLATTKQSLILSSILTHISMTIALSTFIGIVFYHIRNLQQVRKFCCNFKAIQYRKEYIRGGSESILLPIAVCVDSLTLIITLLLSHATHVICARS